MINPYLNPREGRIRAFWRLLLQYALYLFASSALGGAVVAMLVLSSPPGGEGATVTTLSPSCSW